ncbi:hypothetical protein [Geminicoccus flavidas]|uniref:hypothetical protein n=1 Tax=Geminicoccus flavidas TaxID=2506407 RepID=UPI001357CE99|nr:hypothetical protein [Geminicoccus flavidas]
MSETATAPKPVTTPDPTRYLVSIAGRQLDFRQGLPLTAGDWVRMERNPDPHARV